MALKEVKGEARIVVTGFIVTSPGFEDDELQEAADEIASDIGSALCSLGTSCIGGTVSIELDGMQATSDD